MTDKLTQVKQDQILESWQDEIDTCIKRLEAAAGNATRAVQNWQAFVAIASAEDATATGTAVAIELLGRESLSIGYLSTLCKTFAVATGQTNQQIIDKLTTAINA